MVELAFWKLGSTLGRIEIPVDIIRIECLDSPAVRTAGGVVYRTASDADMLEAKAIAVVSRTFLEYRDLVDLYLFASHAAPDAHRRLADKCRRLNIDATRVAARLDDLATAGGHHAAGIDAIIRQQLDPEAAAAILAAGGGPVVLEAVRQLLGTLFGRRREASLVFICARPRGYSRPQGAVAEPAQAVCDLVCVLRRRGLKGIRIASGVAERIPLGSRLGLHGHRASTPYGQSMGYCIDRDRSTKCSGVGLIPVAGAAPFGRSQADQAVKRTARIA